MLMPKRIVPISIVPLDPSRDRTLARDAIEHWSIMKLDY
ncbi:hypothetical protein DSM104440_00120 [Usitatibacter palustris]|uniref:Uncharacterized protein n=1 Tax=Usitatibacter palustris TaxID=2732487 RepID=A0A6M4H614_9PROT|nr:hypothetical protein DSM104440_00120 [Usitatibacter palustris]